MTHGIKSQKTEVTSGIQPYSEMYRYTRNKIFYHI